MGERGGGGGGGEGKKKGGMKKEVRGERRENDEGRGEIGRMGKGRREIRTCAFYKG